MVTELTGKNQDARAARTASNTADTPAVVGLAEASPTTCTGLSVKDLATFYNRSISNHRYDDVRNRSAVEAHRAHTMCYVLQHRNNKL